MGNKNAGRQRRSRHFWQVCERKTRSGILLHGLQAFGTGIHRPRLAVCPDRLALDIRLPHVPGMAHGKAHTVAELWSLAANLTLGHLVPPTAWRARSSRGTTWHGLTRLIVGRPWDKTKAPHNCRARGPRSAMFVGPIISQDRRFAKIRSGDHPWRQRIVVVSKSHPTPLRP